MPEDPLPDDEPEETPIITPAQVIQRMVGLRPYLAQVEDIEELLTDRIAATLREFERELRMCIAPTVIRQNPAPGEVQGVDYDLLEPAMNWERHNLGQLPVFTTRRRPIISVEGIRMKLSDEYELFEFPPGWYTQHIQFNLGQITVVPVPVVGAMLSSTGNMIFTWLTGRMPWPVIPQFVVINYTAGFASPATNPELADLRMHLAEAAALGAIRDLRDMIPSSVSLEGASQSFDSVERRLEQRQTEKDRFFKEWRNRYTPVTMAVI